jgi:hypothetical protein
MEKDPNQPISLFRATRDVRGVDSSLEPNLVTSKNQQVQQNRFAYEPDDMFGDDINLCRETTCSV